MPAKYEKLVKELKGERGVDNPFALAHYILDKKEGKVPNGKHGSRNNRQATSGRNTRG